MNVNANEYKSSRVATNTTGHENQVHSAQESESRYVALRTVPVIIKVQNREVKIKALLDDGRTRSFINEDVVAELGLCVSKMHPVKLI